MNTPPRKELVRGLSLTAAIMLTVGSMIGAGIFRKPATMAAQLESAELLLIVWIVAGLISYIGALCNAEVAGFIDATGGQYIYFKKMYGEFVSFLYGWSILAVIQTGSQAAIAYIFGEYMSYFITYSPLPESWQNISIHLPVIGDIFFFKEFNAKSTAIIAIMFLTFINYLGVKFGGTVQTIVTSIKIFAMFALSFFIFTYDGGSINNVFTNFSMPENTANNLFSLIGLALAGAFWAYDGWNNVTFVAGEVKNPQYNVPRALMWGTLIVMIIYIIINVAYLYIIPVEEMGSNRLIAAAAAEKIFGGIGGTLISIAVLISAFGALNGSILSTARVQFAMAREEMFFKKIGYVHPRFGTPSISLVVQGFWSALLVLSGSFDTITDYVIFASWLFYMLGAYGVIVLRRTMPKAYRPYKVWGYPFTPILFVIFSAVFLINTIISDTADAAFGLILILAGLPFYFYWKHKNNIINKINSNA